MDEDRRSSRLHILKADLGIGVVLVADAHAGFGDVLKAQVLAPEPVAVARINLNPHRSVAEPVVDQGQSGFMLADRRFALPVEAGADQGELPGARRLLAQNAVPPA